jgi:nitroreductase
MNNTDQLISALEWRYATKTFDPQRKLDPQTWAAFEKVLVLSPSSFGLQPYKFIVLTDPKLREQLVPHAWGQRQVADSSHFVVFTARTELGTEPIDHFVQRTAQVRGVTVESLSGYRDLMVGALVKGPASATIAHWSARQAYLALGNLLTSAALLGVDACPMEGFEPAKFDEALGLKGTGFSAVVGCALGYRAATDKYARLPKVRLPESELIQRP